VVSITNPSNVIWFTTPYRKHLKPKGKTLLPVVGYICETDTFANNRRIARNKRRGYFIFRNAAYCFSWLQIIIQDKTS
jgi:hypothetical protein